MLHVVLRLSRDGRALGIAGGAGALFDAPMHASERGLSVAVTSPGSPVIVGHAWTDFRGGTGLEGRCF